MKIPAITALLCACALNIQALTITIDQSITDADTVAFDVVWGSNPYANGSTSLDVLGNYRVEGGLHLVTAEIANAVEIWVYGPANVISSTMLPFSMAFTDISSGDYSFDKTRLLIAPTLFAPLESTPYGARFIFSALPAAVSDSLAMLPAFGLVAVALMLWSRRVHAE